ncbi:MAG: DUF3326 domain-containing protein [Candidatus Moduliflexus flocculans]|nr:DUF3326 domain-containing protein [Candidatus Moduliflexus flocculans]
MIDFAAALIIPTGIGASIGQYAGDASPSLKLISKVCPVITNPNTVNGAVFSGINNNVFYTEGYAIDQFSKEKSLFSLQNIIKSGLYSIKPYPKAS